MPATACLEASVGPGIGQPHDIALVQAMLVHVRDLDGRSYWPARIDGRASDSLADAIDRFQEDFGLLDAAGDDIRCMISPASATFQCLREATARELAGLRAVTGTATLYIPPRGGAQILRVMVARLRSLGHGGDAPLGRRLAALAERIFDRHRFLIRFPAPEDQHPVRRVRVHFHGLKWLTEQGRLTSSEDPQSPVPDAVWALVADETRPIGCLTPEQIHHAGRRELWLRHDG
ncbi:hypothetical protein [Nisaea sp.]|uniref:hypothetical protein n=1 Tax=Nisaea sp. TaxID=2024842 RepID=UPI0032EC0D5B